eukprot:12495811-Alexandrium_andersonii.AAC.1
MLGSASGRWQLPSEASESRRAPCAWGHRRLEGQRVHEELQDAEPGQRRHRSRRVQRRHRRRRVE